MPAWKLRMLQQRNGGVPVGGGTGSTPSSSSNDMNNQALDHQQGIPRNSVASSSSSHDPAEARAKLKKKMEAATLDPNLPPAFKVAMQGRLAFARQQKRRQNNDTWVSLNSSHINKESLRPVDYVDADNGDDDDSSFASMGGDSYEVESNDDDGAIIEGDEDVED